MEIALNRRNFLGYTNYHIFVNNVDGTEVPVETSDEGYAQLANGSTPTLEGHTWKQSLGGALKVDTFTGLMGDKDYVVVDDIAYVTLTGYPCGGLRVPASQIVNDIITLEWQ